MKERLLRGYKENHRGAYLNDVRTEGEGGGLVKTCQ